MLFLPQWCTYEIPILTHQQLLLRWIKYIIGVYRLLIQVVSKVNGYDDWFLPSQDELDKMYQMKTELTMSSYHYWNSSEQSAYGAWAQDFDHGDKAYNNKHNSN